MSDARLPEPFISALSQLGLSLDPSQEQALLTYERLARQWNPKINLIAASTISDIWQRHFLDSAQLAAKIPYKSHCADLGSGGGFPGLVIAILRPDLDITLMESDQRKGAFLQEVTRGTKEAGLISKNPPKLFNRRIEDWKGEKFDIVTARALASLSDLLLLSSSLLNPSGHCLFLKGEKAEAELTEAQKYWHMKVEKYSSVTDKKSALLDIYNIQPKGD